jgi:transglutaminase-like putative cysteine protease
MKPSPPTRSVLPIAPLLGVCLGILAGLAPLLSQVAPWAVLLLIGAAGMRLFVSQRSGAMPSLALKVVLIALGAGGIALTYGSMLGTESGLSILIILVALKVLETNSARDFHVLALLGYFLALCDLFFSQDLLLWLYVGLVVVWVTATLVCFHRGGQARAYWRASRTAGALLLQGLPLALVLFALFPRAYGGFRFQFSRSLIGTAGMSDRLSPGSVASLALSETVAFRASFPDGNVPPLSQMYWRGAVFWKGNGLNWEPGPLRDPLERRIGQLGGTPIRQRIYLQPHGGKWLFALDRPSGERTRGDTARFDFMPGSYLQSQRILFNLFTYEVVSRPENRETVLAREQERAALALPLQVSPRVKALAESWRAASKTDREVIDRALQHFRVERFSYSLEPGSYGQDALDEFLFERRVGFCEHYAATFATLMRLAGIPSRVVIGYHGGELNGSYVRVRQSDAHAWTEAWIKGKGWLRVDPTEAIAPERISSGLASYLESQAAASDDASSGASNTALGWREMMREMRLAWDNINYQWDLRVLNYDEDNQRSFFAQIGIKNAGWMEPLLWLLLAALVLLSLLSLWLRRSGKPPRDEIGRWFAKFTKLLASAGVVREPWEGPIRFGERAAAACPNHAPAIQHVATTYAKLRYGAAPQEPQELADAVRALPKSFAKTGGELASADATLPSP